MATTAEFMAYVHEQAGLGEALSYRKMFGEYALYLDGRVVALACDNSLFLKPTAATAAQVAELPHTPPYPGAKPMPVLDEWLDDSERLAALLRQTAAALPLPKAKPKPKSAASKRAGKAATGKKSPPR